MAETIDQFINEYEEIFNHLGYYPKGLIIHKYAMQIRYDIHKTQNTKYI